MGFTSDGNVRAITNGVLWCISFDACVFRCICKQYNDDTMLQQNDTSNPSLCTSPYSNTTKLSAESTGYSLGEVICR